MVVCERDPRVFTHKNKVKLSKFKKQSDKLSKKRQFDANVEKLKATGNQKQYLIKQELQIIQSLAGNDVTESNRQLKRLHKWFGIRSKSSYPFDDDDFVRIWKGLFYSMWMSDKPLVQEALADNLAELLNAFDDANIAVQFYDAFLDIMCREWFGIDQWRIDKFLMLVRRVTRRLLMLLHENNWDEDLVDAMGAALTKTVLKQSAPISLMMHCVELYMEEIAKVSSGEIDTHTVSNLIRPIILFYARQTDAAVMNHVKTHVFHWLMNQTELGREYKEKFKAWKRLGFRGESINDLEMVEPEEAEEGEEAQDEEEQDEDLLVREYALDPRAGCVDVLMPELPFDPIEIAATFEDLIPMKFTSSRSRKQFKVLITQFKTFADGQFPLGTKEFRINQKDLHLPNFDDKAEELIEFKKELMGDDYELKKMNKRKRKRLVIEKRRNGSLPIEDAAKKPKKSVSVEWKEEEVEDDVALFANDPDSEDEIVPELVLQKKSKKERKLERLELLSQSNKDKSKKKLLSKLHNQTPTKMNGVSADIPEVDEDEMSVTEEIIEPPQEKLKVKKIKGTTPNKIQLPTMDEAANEDIPDIVSTTPSKKIKKIKTDFDSAKKTPKKSDSPGKTFDVEDEWSKPLEEGETESFYPSAKVRVKIANKKDKQENGADLLINPYAVMKTPVLRGKSRKSMGAALSPETPGSLNKSVKFNLKKNIAQEPIEYEIQLRNSPSLPYDSDKKPIKGLLKANAIPSPINPYYKRKGGGLFNSSF